MIQDPDLELVKRSQAGDKAAFGKLVSAYYEMVYAVTFGVVSNHEAAKDVTQEVFLKVYREIGKFQGQSKFKTWLYRVAVNAGIDTRRRRHPETPIDPTGAGAEEDEQPLFVVEDKTAGPRDRAWHSELGQLIQQALETLSADHRAVLVLREWEGASYEEIAEALGIGLGTVMSRLFYARKKMAEILKAKTRDKRP